MTAVITIYALHFGILQLCNLIKSVGSLVCGSFKLREAGVPQHKCQSVGEVVFVIGGGKGSEHNTH